PSVHQHGQFFGPHRYGASPRCCLRPVKSPTLQALRADPQSAAVPHQRLQSGLRAIGEQKQMSTQRIVPELIAHQSEQSFEAFAHVHRLGPEIDLRCRAKAEHVYTASAIRISRARSTSLKAHALSMRRPLDSVNVKMLCACSGATSSFTFTNPATLRFAAAFRLDRCR